MNRINLNYFYQNVKKTIDEESKIVFSKNFQNQICFIKNNKSFYFEYSGFKLVRSINTNKSIKDLIFNNKTWCSQIKLNNITIDPKNIIIISPFTKVKDILSTRVNNNVHKYLKEKDVYKINNEIEQFLLEKIKHLPQELISLIEYDLSKCDLINYIDILDEFINKDNIKNILEVIKTYDKKPLIILNDVDYLSYEEIIDYLQFFNFIYFINNNSESYLEIANYKEFMIDYDLIN